MDKSLLIAVFARSGIRSDRAFWLMALAIATLEAAFQTVTATTAETAAFSGLQLLAFGLVQLYVFRRFGFIQMYLFRIAYYAVWHIGWGALRLRLLF